jgi:hypothetical protein
VNKHATFRKDTNILSRRWLFAFITNNPTLVDLLTAECVIIDMMNGKRFKARSLTGHFCDKSEICFGRMRLTTLKFNSKNSE